MPSILVKQKYLYYTDDAQTEGTTARNTTIFLHGLGSSSCFYKTIIPSLTNVTRCIAMDTRGSGQSPLSGLHQTLDTIATDAKLLLNSLDVQEVIVVGHSMGGAVASALAAMDKRVKGVILLGPVNPSSSFTEVFEKRANLVQNGVSGPKVHWAGLESLADSIPTAATGSRAGALHHAFIRSLILGTSPQGYISLCGVIAEGKQPLYGQINVPLLILAGEEDKTAPMSGCEAILQAYGTSEDQKRIEALSGVGHWHCVEGPEAVGMHVYSFISKLP